MKEAEKAALEGEVPVGAVIVKDGEIIARGHNQNETLKDPTAHAEIMALRQAGAAIVWARIQKLYIGAMDPKAGACGSVFNIPQERKLNHYVEIETGIMEQECSRIMKDFFKKLRNSKSEE